MELLLYAALAASGAAALTSLVHTGLRLRTAAQTQARFLGQEQLVEFAVLGRLEASSGLLAPLSGSASHLEIASPVPDEDPTVFEVSQGVLLMRLGTQAPVALTEEGVTVTEFTVLRLDGTPPSLVFTVGHRSGSMETHSTFSSTLRYD